jgi:hypothetical protein
MLLKDFDGDGVLDIAAPAGAGDAIRVHSGDGSGNFGSPTLYPTDATGSWNIASADFDGDGESDLVSNNTWSHNVSVLLSDGAGSFTAAITFPDPLVTSILAVPLRVLVGDMNGDDKPDLLNLNNDSGPRPPNASVMLNTSPFNQPPDCLNASASAASLWPPNHKFHSISVNDVTDADGDAVTITTDGIAQDEPVNEKGDGNTGPDGTGIGSDTAEVRAERSGKGNGRVYEISYTADDGKGGTCSGTVEVGVPHDKKDTPTNDGATYDSTTS